MAKLIFEVAYVEPKRDILLVDVLGTVRRMRQRTLEEVGKARRKSGDNGLGP
jgi:hypothetical protein